LIIIFIDQKYLASLKACDTFLALLWRERIEVRVVCADFALTLALCRDGRGKSYATSAMFLVTVNSFSFVR
jgi:hypothetical protein